MPVGGGKAIQIQVMLTEHDSISLASSSTVRSLGVIFNQNLSFDSHIKQVSRTAFFHLRNIAKIRNILSQSDAEKLLHAFVTLRLDYCNSLLLGCPTYSLKSLHLIQNAAARVLMRTNRRDHVSPVLASLHWLPVKFRIEFKILKRLCLSAGLGTPRGPPGRAGGSGPGQGRLGFSVKAAAPATRPPEKRQIMDGWMGYKDRCV